MAKSINCKEAVRLRKMKREDARRQPGFLPDHSDAWCQNILSLQKFVFLAGAIISADATLILIATSMHSGQALLLIKQVIDQLVDQVADLIPVILVLGFLAGPLCLFAIWCLIYFFVTRGILQGGFRTGTYLEMTGTRHVGLFGNERKISYDDWAMSIRQGHYFYDSTAVSFFCRGARLSFHYEIGSPDDRKHTEECYKIFCQHLPLGMLEEMPRFYLDQGRLFDHKYFYEAAFRNRFFLVILFFAAGMVLIGNYGTLSNLLAIGLPVFYAVSCGALLHSYDKNRRLYAQNKEAVIHQTGGKARGHVRYYPALLLEIIFFIVVYAVNVILLCALFQR